MTFINIRVFTDLAVKSSGITRRTAVEAMLWVSYMRLGKIVFILPVAKRGCELNLRLNCLCVRWSCDGARIDPCFLHGSNSIGAVDVLESEVLIGVLRPSSLAGHILGNSSHNIIKCQGIMASGRHLTSFANTHLLKVLNCTKFESKNYNCSNNNC